MRTLYEDPRFVFGLGGAWLLFSLLLTLLNERYKRTIRADLDGMTDAERAAFWETIAQHDPEQASEIRELVREWTDWPWRIRDSVVGCILAVGPVVALFWFTGRWSLKSNMVWQDMAARLAKACDFPAPTASGFGSWVIINRSGPCQYYRPEARVMRTGGR